MCITCDQYVLCWPRWVPNCYCCCQGYTVVDMSDMQLVRNVHVLFLNTSVTIHQLVIGLNYECCLYWIRGASCDWYVLQTFDICPSLLWYIYSARFVTNIFCVCPVCSLILLTCLPCSGPHGIEGEPLCCHGITWNMCTVSSRSFALQCPIPGLTSIVTLPTMSLQ